MAPEQPDSMTLPQIAKTLVVEQSMATLATFSQKHADYPFATLVPFALDDTNRPIIFVSDLATHSRNLRSHANASLLVSADQSLASARVSLLGTFETPEADDHQRSLDRYLLRHPAASQWASFGDFRLLRMQLVELYVVGGFGVMGWVKPEEFDAV